MIIPNIYGKIKKCSKPPTRIDISTFHYPSVWLSWSAPPPSLRPLQYLHGKTSTWRLHSRKYMVGGFNYLEKYESQWEGLSHISWKIKNVWNHQPDIYDLDTKQRDQLSIFGRTTNKNTNQTTTSFEWARMATWLWSTIGPYKAWDANPHGNTNKLFIAIQLILHGG